MNLRNLFSAPMLAVLFSAAPAFASSVLPISTDRHLQISAAVFRGGVTRAESYEDAGDGHIYTRADVLVEEVFKGKVPASVRLIHRGGSVPGRSENDDLAPRLRAGDEKLFFLGRRSDGTLYAIRGAGSALDLRPAKAPVSSVASGETVLKALRAKTAGGALPGSDLTGQASAPSPLVSPGKPAGPQPLLSPSSTATNLFADGNTPPLPGRWLAPDRGEPIPYLIDADYLPNGITVTQAVSAVQSALGAWTAVSSLKYVFAGLSSFGAAAANVTNLDRTLRIQLHDHYNYIGGGGDVLGRGGNVIYWAIGGPSPGWTIGGNVTGNDFDEVMGGFVVLQHTNAAMQNLATFTEVLAHEIGHTLGLEHSSQNPSESNPLLSQAIMYFQAHADGRGAQLNAYDIAVVGQPQPPTNTPPYLYDRFMEVVTQPSGVPTAPGVNTIQIKGYDLQTTNLTLALADAGTGSGTFSTNGNLLSFAPNAYYGEASVDPTLGQYYSRVYARFSDGTNASPFANIMVISFAPDSASEGVPDDFRSYWFGSASVSAGPNRHAASDFDGDGFNNLQEYQLGSNPTNASSNLRITSFDPANIQWQAKSYPWQPKTFGVYELYTSTDLQNWTLARNPILTTNGVGSATITTNGGPQQFYRILKVP